MSNGLVLALRRSDEFISTILRHGRTVNASTIVRGSRHRDRPEASIDGPACADAGGVGSTPVAQQARRRHRRRSSLVAIPAAGGEDLLLRQRNRDHILSPEVIYGSPNLYPSQSAGCCPGRQGDVPSVLGRLGRWFSDLPMSLGVRWGLPGSTPLRPTRRERVCPTSESACGAR